MAAKKKAASRKKARVLGNFDYRIDLVTDGTGDDRVVIAGKNDDTSPPPAWAFEPPVATGWLTAFERKLLTPEKVASQLIFRYSIIVEGATAADPAIIIDK